MRIIAGIARGRPLRAPRGTNTRPTSDRVREALFSILGPANQDATVLDLFAGAGTLGLEALSRGAKAAVFVEKERSALISLRQNVELLGFASQSRVIASDVFRAQTSLSALGPYSWVFLDPPYAAEVSLRAIEMVCELPLTDDVVVVAEHDKHHALPDEVGFLVRTDARRYGDTEISLFGKGEIK